MRDFPISQITIPNNRFRKDLGNIDELAADIEQNGLYHPILIDHTGTLVAGRRRLEACKKIGWRTIPAKPLTNPNSKVIEINENTKRKDFTASELAEIIEFVEESRIGHRPEKGSESDPLFGPGKTNLVVENLTGIGHDTIAKIKTIKKAAKDNPKEFGNILQEIDSKIYKVDRAYNNVVNYARKKNSQTPKLPVGVYNILYVDPPWDFENQNTGGSLKSGALQKYPTMTMPELESFGEKLQDSIAKDAVCFMWASVAMLPDAISLLGSWGFDYKGAIFWHKTDYNGLGYWFRNSVEMLIFGIRGHIPAFHCQYSNHIDVKPGKHSEKPEEARQLIEEAIKEIRPQKKIELFARRETTSWRAWGNQVGVLSG